jgi:hypothetical protein
MADFGKTNARFAQAITNGLRWKAGPMLYAAEALLLGGRDKFAVADQRGSWIGMECIKAQNNHT